MSDKPKRQMTPEQLKKLADARAKANEVRSKQAAIKKAEKEKRKQELEQNYNKLVNKETPTIKAEEAKHAVKQPKGGNDTPKPRKKKVTKILEMDSDEESSDSSDSDDSEYDVSPIKEKYRQKYKNKYLSKASNAVATHSPNPYQDAYMIAQHNIKSRVNQEVVKLAYSSLFG